MINSPSSDPRQNTWTAHVLTLFPDMFPGPLAHSVVGRARTAGRWHLLTTNIRDFALDAHRTVDDTPYGGGPGMVLRPDIVDAALQAAQQNSPAISRRVYVTPRGVPMCQEKAHQLANEPGVIFLCGHYEGIDQRVIDHWALDEISVGDFVLSGGELAAMVLIDAVVRLIPEVLGAEGSLAEESFEGDLLEYPHFTRPQVWCDLEVPEVLRSGHHSRIAQWRQAEAEAITQRRRPDLWQKYLKKRHDALFSEEIT